MPVARKLESLTNIAIRIEYTLGYTLLLALLVATFTGCRASSASGLNVPATELRREGDSLPSRFVPGRRLTYKVEYATTSATDFRELFPEQKTAGSRREATQPALAQSFKTRVQGELTAIVLSQNKETADIAYSLRQAEVSLIVNGQEATNQAEQIKTDLIRYTIASVNLRGNVVSVRFDPAVGGLSQSFVRALLALTQFVAPPTQATGLDQWETRESDPSGEYVAHYKALAESPITGADVMPGQKSFSKIKARYIQSPQETLSDEVEASSEINPKGHMVATFDFQRGFLVSLNGMESQTILIAGRTVATAKNSLRMTEVRQETVDPQELASIRELRTERERIAAAVPLFAPPSREATEAAIERTELGDATLESLLSNLAQIESATVTTDETPIYLKFKAMIYLHPESCVDIGRILTTAAATGPTMRILTGALSAVNHADAQAALATAIRSRPEDWSALVLLIPPLGRSPSPTETAEELLRQLAVNSPNPDIASTAQLSLGSMARNLAQIAPERSAKIVAGFVNAIESSTSPSAIRLMILALGNAGSVNAFPIINRFINDASPEMRAAAAEALRWIDNEQVDALLINALVNDRDPGVRQEAAIALGFRKVGDASFKAQKDVFLKERDVQVRLAVLNNLWRVKDAFPEVGRIVQKAAKRDGSKEVRKAAGEINATHS